MTAAVLTGHGGPEMLAVRDDVAVPSVARGEVLIEVSAAAVNTTDIWTREGAYGTADDPDAVVGWKGVPIGFPRIQGGDVVGVVVAAATGEDDAVVGRRVLVDPASYLDDGDEPTLAAVLGSERDGGFAQYVAVPGQQVHDVTDSPLSDVQLACLPIAYGTATGMLERARLRAGETVLVTGASGGVGLALVQLAHARGARVIALTNDTAAGAVLAAGATHTVARSDPSVADRVRQAAGGAVHVVADVVGGWAVAELFPLLATGGRWVTCGAVADPIVQLDLRTLYLHRRQLIGSTMHTPAQFVRLVEDARRGRIDPQVARTYPLTQIHAAQADLATGGHVGKLVLVP
jgi:NADPH:quinone reductase-like Zn-dependent oxidoreductase